MLRHARCSEVLALVAVPRPQLCTAGLASDMDLQVAYAPKMINYSRERAAFLASGLSMVLPLECAPGIIVLLIAQNNKYSFLTGYLPGHYTDSYVVATHSDGGHGAFGY